MKALLNKTIALTGADVPESYIEDLRALGADAFHIPLIQLESFNLAHQGSNDYNWVIFTSVASVQTTPLGLISSSTHIATVGPTTSEAVRQRGWLVDYESPEHTAEALGNQLPIVAGDQIAFPCSSKASTLMQELLVQRGCQFTRMESYTVRSRTLSVHELNHLSSADIVILMSGSAGISFKDQIGNRSSAKLLSIGPSTSRTCKELGLEIAIEADPHNWNGILNSLAKND